MVKGDDSLMRKKNKARRKKLQREASSKSNVSARVASIIAAKKRRLTGKRRQCQGMCFSLPTPDDPFNEKNGKTDFKIKDAKKPKTSQADDILRRKNAKEMKPKEEQKKCHFPDNNLGLNTPITCGSSKIGRPDYQNLDCPSKFLIVCLNAIEKALREEGTYDNEEKPIFVDPWGVEFLKCYSTGKHVSETSSCTVKKIAWMVSIAADSIARKEKQGLSFTSPFLLFLVPSQEKAAEVRSVCKPLKALGIHSVSLHPGASIDHQIHGLKSCEPEFLVSTPKRLLELVSLKAIDISEVSFLVIDGMESFHEAGLVDTVKSIRQSISGNPQAVIFNSVPVLEKLFGSGDGEHVVQNINC